MRVCPVCGGPIKSKNRAQRSCSAKCGAVLRSGPNNCNFNGGLSTCDGRTIIVHRDGTWTFYYRALLEAHLGRPLGVEEIVHHVNGDPTDDRLENLEILSRAEHLEIHRTELLAARRRRRQARLANLEEEGIAARCVWCGVEMLVVNPRQRYCSAAHKWAASDARRAATKAAAR